MFVVLEVGGCVGQQATCREEVPAEVREQVFDRCSTGFQQKMDVIPLGDSATGHRLVRKIVSLDDRYRFGCICENARGQQTRHTTANYDHVFVGI
jgi:hypothetical protein